MTAATASFDSTDVDVIEDFVSQIWSKMTIGNTGGPTRARIDRRLLGSAVEFNDADYSFDISYDADPPEQIIICDVVSNTIERSSDGVAPADAFGPGDQFVISRPGLPYGGVARGTRLRFTQLDPAVLARAAGGRDVAGTGPVRLLDHRPVSRAAQANLQRAITHVRDGLRIDEGLETAPLLADAATQYLAAAVLHTYPNTLVGGPRSAERSDAGASTLRRAIAFVDANADCEIAVADIARAAYVTPRALQLAFRRHLDTTPMAYLRRVRLDLARQDLRRASAETTSVAAVAARWGFTHSRFTQHYVATYRELPSQTLRDTH